MPDMLFTSRENQIIKAVGEGLQNKQIARDLKIAHDTVKRHLTNIFNKLGCSNRVEMLIMVQARAISDKPLMQGFHCSVCEIDKLIRNPVDIPARITMLIDDEPLDLGTVCWPCTQHVKDSFKPSRTTDPTPQPV